MDRLISRQAAIEAIVSQEAVYADDAIDILRSMPTAQRWIPCSERTPEEDYCMGGSGRQFSDEVLVSVANYDDEDIWTYISQTIDGEWALELPSYCKIIAWMPLPEPYEERRTDE